MSALEQLPIADGFLVGQWLFLSYFLLLNGGYMLLNLLSLLSLREHRGRQSLDRLPQTHTGFDPPVSILVPAWNEETGIAATVASLLQLDYPDFEIIVINDGSTDCTLERLAHAFSLQPFPEAYWRRLESREIRAIYRSSRYPALRVIDKENGGKADALNAGINASRCPLFCAVDADSILQRDSLSRVVLPFLEDPKTIAVGGTIRVANGCEVSAGFLVRVGLPESLLARLQVVEYLRAFLFGRLGWSPLNAVLIVSGAFGLFRKETVVAAGGYRTGNSGEDMELIVRLHRLHRQRREPYRISYLPDPICWTEAPESFRVLRRQRTRWQRGLAESLMGNRGLLFHPRGGAAGWIAFPFFMVFELFGPLIEVGGYLLLILGFMGGALSLQAFVTFLLMAASFGLLLSASALLLEEISFRLYTRRRDLLALFLAALIENFGYRQLVTIWRFHGLLRWMLRRNQGWGEMTRSASFRKELQTGRSGAGEELRERKE